MRKNGVVRKRKLGEERKPATYFYRKREHAGPPGAAFHLPRSARSEPEKGSGAPEKECSRLLSASLCPCPSRDPNTATQGHRHLRHSTESLCLPLSPTRRGVDLAPKGSALHGQSSYTEILENWTTPGPQLS